MPSDGLVDPQIDDNAMSYQKNGYETNGGDAAFK